MWCGIFGTQSKTHPHRIKLSGTALIAFADLSNLLQDCHKALQSPIDLFGTGVLRVLEVNLKESSCLFYFLSFIFPFFYHFLSFFLC